MLGVEHRGLHLDRLAAHLSGEERDPSTFWAEHATTVERLRASPALVRPPAPEGSRTAAP